MITTFFVRNPVTGVSLTIGGSDLEEQMGFFKSACQKYPDVPWELVSVSREVLTKHEAILNRAEEAPVRTKTARAFTVREEDCEFYNYHDVNSSGACCVRAAFRHLPSGTCHVFGGPDDYRYSHYSEDEMRQIFRNWVDECTAREDAIHPKPQEPVFKP